MDRERFRQACEQVQAGARGAGGGIGTLSEKTLHAVLKRYMEPYEANHETKIGPYVADIVGENGIVEIQTQGFDKLRKKLDTFLSVTDVTVVYPITSTKWLSWVDTDTGETTAKRKSPKRGSFYHCFYELYKIKQQLTHPGLRLLLILLDMEEYRNLNGWSRDRKRGSSRHERIPVALVDELEVGPGRYGRLIPEALAEPFTSRDFAAAAGLHLHDAQTALNVLHYVKAVSRVGKMGRLYAYQRG